MSFSWPTAIAQVIVFALVVLFFVSIYLFANRIINHTRRTQASLVRLEDKMDIILKEIKNHKD